MGTAFSPRSEEVAQKEAEEEDSMESVTEKVETSAGQAKTEGLTFYCNNSECKKESCKLSHTPVNLLTLQSKKEWCAHVVSNDNLHFSMKTTKFFQDKHGTPVVSIVLVILIPITIIQPNNNTPSSISFLHRPT